MPQPQTNWEERYQTGNLPWDTGEPDRHLVEVVGTYPILPGSALEIGCGTGTNALWLAEQGFEVLGVDVSGTAIVAAQKKAEDIGANCRFAHLDFLHDQAPEGPFDFVFDRGCLHVFDDAVERAEFAQRVASLLAPGGIWLSLVGSTEGAEREGGPPRRSVRDLANAIEPVLEIMELRSGVFDTELPTPARAWRCIARRRDLPAQPSTRR